MSSCIIAPIIIKNIGTIFRNNRYLRLFNRSICPFNLWLSEGLNSKFRLFIFRTCFSNWSSIEEEGVLTVNATVIITNTHAFFQWVKANSGLKTVLPEIYIVKRSDTIPNPSMTIDLTSSFSRCLNVLSCQSKYDLKLSAIMTLSWTRFVVFT